MSKYLLTFCIACTALLTWQTWRLEDKRKEAQRLKENNEALMEDVSFYETSNGLNAGKVRTLTLTLDEYKKYHAEDMATIAELTKKRDIAQSVKTSTRTEAKIRTEVKDSIIYINRERTDTMRCIDYNDTWLRVSGCVQGGEFSGDIESTDTLLIATTVKYKRFLGFLWKTSKIKDKRTDIVSKNPHTHISGLEHIIIE